MRIACVYLPSFPLQAALVASDLPAELHPLAVVSQPAVGAPVVVACSRAAWAAGVRPTMTASVARALVADLQCILADVAGERALLRAVGDALLSVAPRIDLGGEPRGQHHVMYVEVPAGRRGSWFGARVAEVLAAFGLRGRVGIADDRFTAFVAASGATADDAVVSVPRGGSAAFLAPQPLRLLQLAPEVQHMLEALGVRTLGAFAELPPPSVTRSAAAWDADFQALARGDGGNALDAYVPSGPLSEQISLAAGAVGPAVQAMARRLAYRLAGRGVPDTLVVRLTAEDGDSSHVIDLDGEEAVAALADDLADAIGRLLGDDAWTAIEVRTEAAPAMPAAAQVAAAPSAPVVSHDPEPVIAPLVLVPPARLLGYGERAEHRRTRRGKQRPRIAIGQARLFAGE